VVNNGVLAVIAEGKNRTVVGCYDARDPVMGTAAGFEQDDFITVHRKTSQLFSVL